MFVHTGRAGLTLDVDIYSPADAAMQLLKERRRVMDADIATAVAKWGWTKNRNRMNVLPDKKRDN